MMQLDLILNYIDYISKIVLACFCILCGILFHSNSLQSKISSQKYLLLGFALFCYAFGITRAFFLYTDYRNMSMLASIGPSYDQNLDSLFIIPWKFASLMSILALTFLIIVVETYIVKTRYIFSGICVFGVIAIIFIQDKNLINTISLIIFPLIVLDLLFAYIYVAIKAKGIPRKNSLLSFTSFILLGVGVFLDTELVESLIGLNISILGSISMFLAFLLFIYANYRREGD